MLRPGKRIDVSPRRLRVLLLLCAGLAGCCSRSTERRWPFPRVPGGGDSEVLRILRERSEGPQSLYAVLRMAFDLPGRSGVAEAVVRYEAPGRIRLIAYKDLLVSSRGIFDLVITPERFALRFEGDDGPVIDSGPLDKLGSAHPGFGAFGHFREALFLPGRCPAGTAPQVARQDGAILVRARTPSGQEVEWELDHDTLGVTRARSRIGAATVEAQYMSYCIVDGIYLPEAFDLRDPEHGVHVEGRLLEIELNPDWSPEDFELER